MTIVSKEEQLPHERTSKRDDINETCVESLYNTFDSSGEEDDARSIGSSFELHKATSSLIPGDHDTLSFTLGFTHAKGSDCVKEEANRQQTALEAPHEVIDEIVDTEEDELDLASETDQMDALRKTGDDDRSITVCIIKADCRRLCQLCEIVSTAASSRGLDLTPIIIDSVKQLQQALGRGRKALHPSPGPMRYQCPVCPYSTNKKGHYVVHERVHTGEKPYKCPLCPYRATQKSSVTIHMVVHQRSASRI
ncbi:zinc finger protein-like [Tropilaelaps mercedesae]|uniref:Zinc finger protein-like n=1 Tax=Tropilaelaps mercedesae TaxID=418985 RepID=A0A1V9XEI9_9ACAR|nr:zinc finger protein-like [Tropilaelaps mercedesae]